MSISRGFNIYFFLGIAGLRVIYIRFTFLVETKFRETVISYIILTSTLVVAVICIVIMVIVPKKGVDIASLCMDASWEMEEATGGIGGDSALRLGVVSLGVILVLLQLYFYLYIFNFLTNHDQAMAHILPAITITKRRRQNAINLTGNMLTFAFDMLLMTMAVMTNRWLPDSIRQHMRYLFLSPFGMSGVLCIASNSLYRQYLSETLSYIADLLFFRRHTDTQ